MRPATSATPRLLFLALVIVLLFLPTPAFCQAGVDEPVYISWMVHVDPSPWDVEATWNKGRNILDLMGQVIESHGGNMVVACSWNFINGCLMFGNGPGFPGSLGDLASRGHEIAYHDHGGVTLTQATVFLNALTTGFSPISYPQHIEGGGSEATLSGLGYRTRGTCPKDRSTQLVDIGQIPFRRDEEDCYSQDPSGFMIGLSPGAADGSGRASSITKETTRSLQYAIEAHTPGKLSFVNLLVSHPDDWLGASPFDILTDMQTIDDWLTEDIDPLLASGVVVWTDSVGKADLFEQWEADGGTNEDLFPEPAVVHPDWSFLDPTNSPLTTDRIDEVLVDSSRRVWIGGGEDGVGGLFQLDGESWTVFDPSNSPLRSYRVVTLADGGDGSVWIGTFDDGTPGPPGTALHHFDGTTWTIFDSTNSPVVDPFLFDVAVDSAGIVWTGGRNGLYRYDGASWSSYSQPLPGFPTSTGIFCITPVDTESLWLGLRNGGVAHLSHGGDAGPGNDVWTVHTSTSTSEGIPANTVYAVAVHPDGSVYAGTRRGLAIFDGGSWESRNRSDSELGYDQIVDIDIDGYGDVWLATFGGGVSRYRPSLDRFHVEDVPDGTTHGRYLNTVAVGSNEEVFFGSMRTGGISRYTPQELTRFADPVIGATFGLTVNIPEEANLPYRLLASITTDTGTALPSPDSRIFPLDQDDIFRASLRGDISQFGQFSGVLSSTGGALATVQVPDRVGLSGRSFYLAGVTLDEADLSGVSEIFGPVQITLE